MTQEEMGLLSERQEALIYDVISLRASLLSNTFANEESIRFLSRELLFSSHSSLTGYRMV